MKSNVSRLSTTIVMEFEEKLTELVTAGIFSAVISTLYNILKELVLLTANQGLLSTDLSVRSTETLFESVLTHAIQIK